MTGDVKSVAGVRVPWKIVSVISWRLIDIEIAGRRRITLFTREVRQALRDGD